MLLFCSVVPLIVFHWPKKKNPLGSGQLVRTVVQPVVYNYSLSAPSPNFAAPVALPFESLKT